MAQITAEALSLLPDERVSLAQTLLKSVETGDAVRRDVELSAGTATVLPPHSAPPKAKPWMEGFGAFVGEEEELARIQAVIDEEFGQIDPEDWR